MSARTARTRLFALSTVALAALALTACESGSDTGASSPSSSTTATAGAKPSTGDSAGTAGGTGANDSKGTDAQGDKGTSAGSSGTGTGKGTATGTGGGKGNGTGSGSGAQDKGIPGKCSASDVRITATEVPRPINHLLLTATNTGSKTCHLPAYPQARFGEAQSVPPVAEETKPQAVTTLEPGASGYAGVLLSAGDGSGGNGRTVNTLTVPFDDGSIATVSLPSGGVHVDDALTVTYWQTDVDLALSH
ncbi:DUF4232 domain-containing protein [Streptomyces sp. Tu 3180]|uniref:DUF4232 domain-containing protein n=1 Tax=Streptomyces sp. Tu 3180 TaxID=2682611 RepID=UPI001359D32F|nr:DUF4232 domain-containing protein [Streptomyces sp. Tu 3180]KAF3466751.1 DUF4232 domain-containing protein [Streptomyces sp. Tu 3180]